MSTPETCTILVLGDSTDCTALSGGCQAIGGQSFDRDCHGDWSNLHVCNLTKGLQIAWMNIPGT